MKRTFKHQRRYHSLNQNKFHIRNAYSLLSKYIKIKLYRTLILPLVLYGCETWSLTLREERRLRLFEDRLLRRIFGPKRDETIRERRKLHNEHLNDLCSSPNIVRVIKSRMRWAEPVARKGRGEGYTGFWWGNLGERHHFQDSSVDGWIVLRWIIRKWDRGVRTGSSWLRIGIGGEHLWLR